MVANADKLDICGGYFPLNNLSDPNSFVPPMLWTAEQTEEALDAFGVGPGDAALVVTAAIKTGHLTVKQEVRVTSIMTRLTKNIEPARGMAAVINGALACAEITINRNAGMQRRHYGGILPKQKMGDTRIIQGLSTPMTGPLLLESA